MCDEACCSACFEPAVQRHLVGADHSAYVLVGESVLLELDHLADELLDKLRAHVGASLQSDRPVLVRDYYRKAPQRIKPRADPESKPERPISRDASGSRF